MVKENKQVQTLSIETLEEIQKTVGSFNDAVEATSESLQVGEARKMTRIIDEIIDLLRTVNSNISVG